MLRGWRVEGGDERSVFPVFSVVNELGPSPRRERGVAQRAQTLYRTTILPTIEG